MTTTHGHELAPVVLDGSWVEETRQTVADGFDCGVCLDFGYLDGLGPCPHCDPDGYAEHTYYTAQERRSGLDSPDPWASTGTAGVDLVWSRT